MGDYRVMEAATKRNYRNMPMNAFWPSVFEARRLGLL